MRLRSESQLARSTQVLRALVDRVDGDASVQAPPLEPTNRREETERMASLGTLAAGVAHEINNPLSYVLSSLEIGFRELLELRALLASGSRELGHVADAVRALDSAREGAERVRNIVRDLMDFARPAAVGAEVVDIEAILDATVRVAWNEIRHRARLVKRYSGLAPVCGDEARLGQVFLNLIVNAAQSIEGEPGDNEIRISTTCVDGSAVVEVADTGSGIESSLLPRVFEPFYTTKATTSGVGLGLAICRDIVTSLGGQISVSSEPRRGTSFRVVLPFAPEESAARRAVVEPPTEAASVRSRILIVDDEPLLGQTLCYAFKGRHEVAVCTSGREALKQLESDAQFDLVLCDLMMPDVSGAAVYEWVKQTHPELLGRFVFMTGGAFTERARAFLEHYPGAQLEKPFNINDVEKLLRQMSKVAAVRG